VDLPHPRQHGEDAGGPAQREGRALPFSALQDPALVPEPSVSADRFLHSEHAHWRGHWGAPPAPWEPEERLLGAETREVLALAIEGLRPRSGRALEEYLSEDQ
jgi:hypothetical protein